MFNSDKHSAVLIMPRGALAEASETPLARWLARGDAAAVGGNKGMISRVTDRLGATTPGQAAGALRFWGQTGERPSVWMAAADPVYFEPMIDHLRLRSLPREDVSEDAAELFDGLERALGADTSLGFMQLEGAGYLRAEAGKFETATRSAGALDGEEPSQHMPEGPGAGALQRLLSEIQMSLHQSPVQERRERAGRRPVNGLWVWGGGIAPEPSPQPLPPLFGNDDVAHGYWRSAAAPAGPWPGSLSACLEECETFVAWLPAGDRAAAVRMLEEARRLVGNGRLRRLDLLFPESLEITVTRSQRFRFWRRRSELPGLTGAGS